MIYPFINNTHIIYKKSAVRCTADSCAKLFGVQFYYHLNSFYLMSL
nr:MAG TPA: hypothetical protein [Caudoviricetes sp.]